MKLPKVVENLVKSELKIYCLLYWLKNKYLHKTLIFNLKIKSEEFNRKFLYVFHRLLTCC